MNMTRFARLALVAALAMLLLIQCVPVMAESAGDTRWADASDQIDKFLDTAFEDYLAGDAASAYQNVSDAYFRVYETTGFERQTMTYISGNRKNAVEMQFSACKSAVKKENTDPETITSVRSALVKLKTMIRDDGNTLAGKQGGVTSENKWYKAGEMVDADPYPEYSADPNAAMKYESWYEVAVLTQELLDTAFQGYLDKDFEAAVDNLQTAYYTVYEESGLDHKIYTDLSLEDRLEVENSFSAMLSMAKKGDENYSITKYRKRNNGIEQMLFKKAKKIDEQEAEAKAAANPEAAETDEAEVEAAESDPRLLTFLGAFGIIVREGLEAILVIAAIIAYLTKSGNGKSLKNVYIGAIAGIAASFAAAAVLAWAKSAFASAGLAQEIIEGITALIAVCVLFYVSNWMISKAEAASWSRYIDNKVQSSVEQGSAFALAFTAFLSVFREGAEVVLFYQPMLSEGNPGMVWAGFGAGCVLLVFVYLAITKLSIKLPIKVFFTATSILMAVMCVSFLGSGIKELAEGNVFDLTLNVPGIPENDVIQIFGIYPWLETLVPQLILSIVLLVTFMIAHYRGKIDALKAQYAGKN